MDLPKFNTVTTYTIIVIVGSLVGGLPVFSKATTHSTGEQSDYQRTAMVSSAQPNPVNFTVYLESRCGDCQAFIGSQLRSAYEKVLDIMNVSLVPFGNAEEIFNNKTNLWEFVCQHGEEECQFNLVETCALHFYNFSTIFPVILCLEIPGGSPTEETKKCFSKYHLDYEGVIACYNGKLGNSLEHQMAVKTNALRPPHKYVPWVTVNQVHTDAIQTAATSNLVQLICDTYTGAGKKPAACHTNS